MDENDAHHRLLGQFGAAIVPFEWLAISAKYDLRHDWHSGDDGSDRGIAGQSTYILQTGAKVDETVSLGAEGVIWIPSGTTQARTLRATSFDLNLLATYLPRSGPYTLSGRAGYRFDNSRKAVGNDADRMSRADRLALGVCDANALLLGAAIAWSLPDLDLLGEWTWDLLLGDAAPSALQTPMRLSAGVRWPFSQFAALHGIIGVSPSGRPAISARDHLVAVEPRFWINASLAIYLPWETVVVSLSPRTGPRRADIEGQVKDTAGKPVAQAQVSLADAPAPGAQTDEQGRFRLTGVEVGPHRLSVCGPRLLCQTVSLNVTEGTNPAATVTLEPAVITLRGVVLAPNGDPVAGAKVSVGNGERALQTITDSQGRYELADVPVGAQELKIAAEGWDQYSQPIRLTASSAPLTAELKRPLPDGQIRGQVRSFGGKRLVSTIVIEPIGHKLRTDAKGQFTVDVPPGEYQVTVQATGHHSQTKTVRVEHNSVTVLAIDLHRKRP